MCDLLIIYTHMHGKPSFRDQHDLAAWPPDKAENPLIFLAPNYAYKSTNSLSGICFMNTMDL